MMRNKGIKPSFNTDQWFLCRIHDPVRKKWSLESDKLDSNPLFSAYVNLGKSPPFSVLQFLLS